MTASETLLRARDKVLDSSIVFSYGHSGFKRHAESFDETETQRDLEHAVVLFTGANSGIGKETARALAGRGPEVWLLCRNLARADAADTAIWLAASNSAMERSGLLWFDRAPQTTHLMPWTREGDAERDELWRQLCEWIGVDAHADWLKSTAG